MKFHDVQDECGRFRAAASADLDGARAEAGWETHARLCAECRTFGAELRRARRDLALIANAPVPDLWVRIAARAPRQRPWVPVLWRAAALLVGLAGTLSALWAAECAREPRRAMAPRELATWASLAPLREPSDLLRAAEAPEFQLLAQLTTPREDER